MNHPAVGEIKLVNTSAKFRQNQASVKAPAFEAGQRTEEILLELGYRGDDMVQLKDDGVIL